MRSRMAFGIASSVPWGPFDLTVALLVSALVLSLGGEVGGASGRSRWRSGSRAWGRWSPPVPRTRIRRSHSVTHQPNPHKVSCFG